MLTVALTVVIALAALLFAGPAPAAHADTGRLEFSRDGITWAAAPPEALFRDGLVLVPGTSADATVHIRSTAETAGVLRTSVTNIRTSDEDAEEYFGISSVTDTRTGADGAATGLERTRVADLAELTPLGAPQRLEPGQSVTFTLTINLDLQTGAAGAQNSAIGLDLAVSFTDSAAGGGAGGAVEPALILPVLPPAEGGERPVGQNPVPTAGEPREGALTEPAPAGTEALDGTGRGTLAITGITRSAIVAAITFTVLGGLLLLASRATRRRS